MNLKKAPSTLRALYSVFPFRLNAVLLLLLTWAAWAWMQSRQQPPQTETPDSITPLLILLLQIAGLTLAFLVTLTFLLTLFAWIGLWISSRGGKKPVAVTFSAAPAGGLQLRAALSVSPLPFWGTALLQLFFKEGGSAPPVLLERKGFSLLPVGKRQWHSAAPVALQRVQAYKVEHAFVQLRDVFGLFAFSLRLPASALALSKPGTTGTDRPLLPPSRATDTTERIEELKPVEGELFQYKDFETGDDMRRIVWKVYARNRDLVVRTPERLEPYASQIDLWASFGAAFPLAYDAQNEWAQELLSFYKTALWGLYNTMSRQGLQPRFHADQEVTLSGSEADTQAAAAQHAITVAQWTDGHSLPAGAGRKGEVVVVSALVAPEALDLLLQGGKRPSAVCLVTLSEAIPMPRKENLLARIFLRPAHSAESRLQQGWRRSGLRRVLQKREETLRSLIDESGVKGIYL